MRGVYRVSGNAAAILLSDGTNKAAIFILYALVARHLGTFEFSQLSLALTLFYSFQIFALAGLKTLTARAVANDREKTDTYLVNGSVITIASSVLSIGCLLLFTRIMGYAPETSSLILLLSLGLVSYSLSSLCEAVFQAWERMHYIAYTNVPLNVLTMIGAFLLLSHGYGLLALVILLLATSVVGMSIKWWLLLQNISRPTFSIDLNACTQMLRSAFTFLGTDGFIVVLGSMNFILLSKLGGRDDVGLYNAATQVIAPMTLVYQGILSSLFPLMCRKFQASAHALRSIAENLAEALLIVAIPTAIGLFFLADSAFMLLYGNKDFLVASEVLRIMVWTLVTTALIDVFGQVLIASHQEGIRFRIVATNTVINLLLGVLLISHLGLLGAAITSLLMGVINLIQHYIPLSRILRGGALGRMLWKPLIASAGMICYFTMAKSQSGLLSVVPASSIYFGALLCLAIWSSGGLQQFKMRYLGGWSN